MSDKTIRSGGIPRRTFLRGVGVTMSLPWLESLASRAMAAEAGAPITYPKRFAVFFMGNGVSPNHWWAKGSGADLQLGKTLDPLESLKSRVNVINGLFNKLATGHGIHPPMTGNLLTGAPLSKGAIIHSGISMDQMLANRVGQDTPQPSLVLACEQPMTGYHETNYSNAYGSHISWQNADSPVPNEIYPSLAFDSLFENRGSQRNLSVLDRVRERATKLSTRLSSTDKAKLDEYLTSVRDVEKRIDRMRTDKSKAEDRAKSAGKPIFTMKRPENGLPEDLREHTRLMCDIIAMAFQTDKSRIASLILARDLSSLYYPFLNVRDAHHSASHHDTSDDYERISRFHLSQLAYLAKRLNDMPEGDGTVLDNSCLLFISNMFSGTRHDNSKVPIVTVGGLGGALKTGRALDYRNTGDDNRKLCSLYLSLMDRMGVRLDHFGDAESRLPGF
ncbi:MAG TPA: DUF1552 domain-containing protein [Tepidisphaeraceae bacterium]|nr:DUF1552 domain-containing protein [Tepidisphaeraceae bacterium]